MRRPFKRPAPLNAFFLRRVVSQLDLLTVFGSRGETRAFPRVSRSEPYSITPVVKESGGGFNRRSFRPRLLPCLSLLALSPPLSFSLFLKYNLLTVYTLRLDSLSPCLSALSPPPPSSLCACARVDSRGHNRVLSGRGVCGSAGSPGSVVEVHRAPHHHTHRGPDRPLRLPGSRGAGGQTLGHRYAVSITCSFPHSTIWKE